MTPQQLTTLREILNHILNEQELRDLCFDMPDVEYESLPHNTKPDTVRALIEHLYNRHRIPELLDLLEKERPKENWGQFRTQIDLDSPYRGLKAFRQKHAKYYFGRETFVAQLREVVPTQTLIPVIGPSGSGKSSVVFAGLLPHLQDDSRWCIATLRPGNDPFGNLARELLPLYEDAPTKTHFANAAEILENNLWQHRWQLPLIMDWIAEKQADSQQFLLVVDQFEELYTLKSNDTREAFLDQLIRLAETTSHTLTPHIIYTLRADFLGKVLAYQPFVTLINQHQDIKLSPLAKEELQRVIEEPAKVAGATFAEGLVSRILEDVGDEPGNLPLLQFALTLLWERQDNGTLTHGAYEAINGVGGALAHYADEVYGELKETEQQQAQRVFVQLVSPGAGTEDTRRWATSEELGDTWALVQRLATERLIVTNRAVSEGDEDAPETVEVTHEALIQRWGKLQAWLDEDRDFRMWQERLRADMNLWTEHNEQEGYLLQSTPLSVAEDWISQRGSDLSGRELTYIEVSLQKRTERESAEVAHRRQIIGSLISGVAILGVLAVLLFLSNQDAQLNAAIAQTREAEAVESARVAEEAQKLANARQLISQGRAEYEDNPLLGLSLVIEGIKLASEIGKAEEVLEDTRDTIFQQGRIGKSESHIELVGNYKMSMILVQYDDKPSELYSISDGSFLRTLAGSGVQISSISEKLMMISYKDGPTELRDTNTLEIIYEFPGLSSWHLFGANYDFLLLTYEDSSSELYKLTKTADVTTLEIIDRFQGLSHASFFGENDELIILSYENAPSKLYNIKDRKIIEQLPGKFQGVSTAIIGNETIIFGYEDAPSELRNTSNGSFIDVFDEHFSVLTSTSDLLAVSYKDYSEIRSMKDGSILSDTLPAGISSYFGSTNNDYLWMIIYENSPSELRNPVDGSLIYTLPGIATSYSLPTYRIDETSFVIRYQNERDELRNSVDGSLIKTFSKNLDSWMFTYDSRVLIIDYVDSSGELRDASNGLLIEELAGEIESLKYESNFLTNSSTLLLIDYVDALGEFRNIYDGSIIDILPGKVSESSHISDNRWIISYNNSPSELRDKYNGALIKTFPIEATFSTIFGSSLFILNEGTQTNLYDPDDGSLIVTLPDIVSEQGGIQDFENFFLIKYQNAASEIRSSTDGTLIMRLADSPRSINLIENTSIAQALYDNGDREILDLYNGSVIVNRSNDIKDIYVVDDTQVIIVNYKDGASYILDTEWLVATYKKEGILSSKELISLACTFPLKKVFQLGQSNWRSSLQDYLDQVGIDEPQACN